MLKVMSQNFVNEYTHKLTNTNCFEYKQHKMALHEEETNMHKQNSSIIHNFFKNKTLKLYYAYQTTSINK